MQSRWNWLLFAAFGVVAAALAFGAWAGFPVYADAYIPLLVRELPPGGRDGDWKDVSGVLARQAGKLDTALIFRELEPLLELKEDTASAARLKSLLERG